MVIGEIGSLDCSGGGLDGCGVGVGVASLLDKLEPLEDGILMGSLGVKDLRPNLVFLFFGKKEGIIGWLGFFCTTGSSFRSLGKIRGPSSSISLISLSF